MKPTNDYKPSTFRIRIDLDREVSILAATFGRTKQDLMEEATQDLEIREVIQMTNGEYGTLTKNTYTVLLECGTVGTLHSLLPWEEIIDRWVRVTLQDENGNMIAVSGRVVEVLE